jgi:hypothetical protein
VETVCGLWRRCHVEWIDAVLAAIAEGEAK